MVYCNVKIKAKYFASVLIVFNCFYQLVYSACGTPPTVANGVVSSTGPYNAGDTATYTCNTGYVLTVSASITCDNSSGVDQWVTSLPECVCNDASCYQTVTVTQTVLVTEPYTLPAWTIALMATFGALLFLTLLALIIILSCCCCRCCPYYMCTKCCGEKREKDSNKEKVNDNIEYYYDVDKGVYVNSHTGAQYYTSPDRGRYLGRFSPSGRDVNNPGMNQSPQTMNKNNVIVTDIEKQEQHIPQTNTVFVNGQANPPPSHVTAPSQVVLVDRNHHEQPPKTTQPQYVVVDKSPTVHKPPPQQEPQVVYVTSKKKREQPSTPKVQPQYVIVSDQGPKTPPSKRNDPQPQIVVINNKPKPEKEHPQIVYVSHDGTPQRRRKVSRSASTRVILPHAVYDDDEDDIEQPRRRKVSRSAITGKPPENYPDYDSEPETVSPQKHHPHVRYKFQTAIDRVMGAHKFKKRPVQSPEENWMPHSKPIRGTNGLQYTSTR